MFPALNIQGVARIELRGRTKDALSLEAIEMFRAVWEIHTSEYHVPQIGTATVCSMHRNIATLLYDGSCHVSISWNPDFDWK